ncbi:MAG TPA: hypothetical protein VI454_11895 [Verrucomicrobiae bacterium]|jgi:hypothetical protein
MNSDSIVYAFSFCVPALVLVLAAQGIAATLGRSNRSRTVFAVQLVLALALTCIPVDGLPLARCIAGFNANFSIPLVGLLVAAVWRNATSRQFLRPDDFRAAWIFGAASGVVLYPLALGLGSFDPYALGWDCSLIFIAVAALTVGLIWKQNGFGVLLLAAVVAFNAGLLESTNFWDYLVDPFYFVASVITLGVGTLRARNGSTESRATGALSTRN